MTASRSTSGWGNERVGGIRVDNLAVVDPESSDMGAPMTRERVHSSKRAGALTVTS